MAEYIEREKLLRDINHYHLSDGKFQHWVEVQQAADVATVRHGRWEFLGPNRLIGDCMCGTCSVCKVRCKYIVNKNICPNCGADMRGEEE